MWVDLEYCRDNRFRNLQDITMDVLFTFEVDAEGHYKILRENMILDISAQDLSQPEHITFPTEDGRLARAFYYPPCNANIFFQGTEDKVVPPSQTEQMFEALKRNGIKAEYFLFPGEQHGFRQAALLGKHLFLNREFPISGDDKRDILKRLIKTVFSVAYVKYIIYKNHIDFKDIWENPTQSKIDGLISILEQAFREEIKKQQVKSSYYGLSESDFKEFEEATREHNLFVAENKFPEQAWTSVDIIYSSKTKSEIFKGLDLKTAARFTYAITPEGVFGLDLSNEPLRLAHYVSASPESAYSYFDLNEEPSPNDSFHHCKKNISKTMLESFCKSVHLFNPLCDDWDFSENEDKDFVGSIGQILEQMADFFITPAVIESKTPKHLKNIAKLTEKYKLFNDVYRMDNTEFMLDESQQKILEDIYPLIFILEDEALVKKQSDEYEYRSTQPRLQIGAGKEIPLVATDTLENQHKLCTLFNRHQTRLHVVNFEDLKVGGTNRPESKITHSDGFPKLAWLAFKQLEKKGESRSISEVWREVEQKNRNKLERL